MPIPNRRFHSLKNSVFEGNLRASEPIDARKPLGYTSSEANRRATAKKSLENHSKLDAGGRDVRMGCDSSLERFQAQPKWEIPDQ